MTEKNILDNSYNICNYNENNNNEYIDNDKRFLTERNDNRNIRKIKIGEFSNLIEEIKVKLYIRLIDFIIKMPSIKLDINL